MEPKASILIITYNQQDTIAAAIDSCLSQQCPFPFEIVIGEDASTDGTRSICEDYARRYPDIIRLLPPAPNKGIVGNYFDVLEAARGEYVSDCAGDDIWADPRRLRRQAEYLDSHPDDVAVLSDWEIIRGDSSAISRDIPALKLWHRHNSGQETLMAVLGAQGNFPFLSAMMFRRSVLARILASRPSHLRRDEWGCEDLPVVAALAASGDIGYIPLKASRYFISTSSSSASNAEDSGRLFDFYIKGANCILDLCDIYGINPGAIAPAFLKRVKFLAAHLLCDYTPARGKRFTGLCDRIPHLLDWTARIYLFAMPHAGARCLLRMVKLLKPNS